jgi:hypothetical protein
LHFVVVAVREVDFHGGLGDCRFLVFRWCSRWITTSTSISTPMCVVTKVWSRET